MDKLFIVDGNSLLFRAFYALPPMYNSTRTPTNAVFGFTKMLLNIISKNRPKYLAVAFDAGKHTFRHNIFAEYKGTRKPMPDELRVQLPILKDLLKQMNITTIEIPEIEADDIIGTLSKKFDIETVLISGDRDLLQLISPSCRVWLTQKGLTDVVDLDEAGLNEKYGIQPYQVIEMKSIMGDSSDNIPGVKGLGEKTATKLITEYGNLDNIYNNIDCITGKTKTLLQEQKDMAYISKQLATIKTDCKLNCNLEDLLYDFPFSLEVKETFKYLEFKNLLEKQEYFVATEVIDAPPETIGFTHQEVNDNDKIDVLNNLLNSSAVAVNFDEMGMCIASANTEYQFLPFDLAMNDIYQLIKQILESKTIEKVVYDAKEMMHTLKLYNIELNNFYDISLAYYLIGLSDREIMLKNLLANNNLSNEYITINLLTLKKLSLEKLESMNLTKLYYELELKLVPVLYQMELAGIKVDCETIKVLGEKYRAEEHQLTEKIYRMVDEEFNIKSPKQLQDILFTKLKLQYKGKKSTNIDVLEAIQGQHPVVQYIIRYRKVSKIGSTYLDGLLPYIKNGKLHTTYVQTITSTGRLSSREPNLQNIPVRDEEGKELRKLFTSSFDDGVIISADYSQIELRLLAHYCKDENLISSFRKGQDIHASTASRVFDVALQNVTPNMRSMAKAVNFGIIYGISEYGLAKNVHITSMEAREFIAKYFEMYPAIKKYMDNNIEVAKSKGYASTLMGRIRFIPELASTNRLLRQFGERVAMNMPLQGTASDIIKMAMINVQNKMIDNKLRSKLILQIHDELVVDACKDEIEIVTKILKQEMENVVKLNIPLVVDINMGKSWFDAK